MNTVKEKESLCGICGIYEFGEPLGSITSRTLVAMCDTMAHRGPDDAGWLLVQPGPPLVYLTDSGDCRGAPQSSGFIPTVGLGHRRLSIIDLSPRGHQPMRNEDGTVWLSFNGEIYNHVALREELEKTGHQYRSRTDTETILHLYEEQGEACVPLLDGMFAFALFDSRAHKLLLARDPIGVKPLYYCVQPNRILFASEIKAILAVPGVSRRLDEHALHHYLTFLAAPAPSTLFAGIRKLPAGHYLTVDRHGTVTVEQYWDAAGYGRDEFLNATAGMAPDELESYCVTSVRDLLRRSIEKRMMSDVPFGVFLSGGLDSSLNVALMSELSSSPVETFSVGLTDSGDADELQFARQVATRFATNHHEIVIDSVDFLDFVHEMAYYQDEPLADPVCVPLYYLSKLARESGIVVVQIGEGSDELFCGYGHYVNMATSRKKQWDAYHRAPFLVRRGVYQLSRAFASDKWQDFLYRAAHDRELFWSGATLFGESQKRRLLKDPISGEDSLSCIRQHLDQFDAKRKDGEFLERMIYLELKHRLPELLLMRIDKMSMANSIEGREPFLDRDLVRLALNIPLRMKIRGGTGKFVLKAAARGIIPDQVIDRPKMGFCGGSETMLTDRVLDFTRDLYLGQGKGNRAYRDLFNPAELKRLFSDQYAKRADNSGKIWGLMNFALWYDRWL